MNLAESISGNSVVEANDEYTVVPLVTGEILRADFEEGDKVQKDQVLYEIDSSDAMNSIKSSDLSIQKAENSSNDARDSINDLNVTAPFTGTVAMIVGSLQRPDYLKSINVVNGNITHIAWDKLIGDNVTYKISDKVAVYKRESATAQEYSMTDLSEVVSNKDKYKISAFYDKESKSGGRIRVIVISEK